MASQARPIDTDHGICFLTIINQATLRSTIIKHYLGGEGHVLEAGPGQEAVVRLPHVLADKGEGQVAQPPDLAGGGLEVVLLLVCVLEGGKGVS